MDWKTLFIYEENNHSCLIWNVNIFDTRGHLTKARIGAQAGSVSGNGHWQVKHGKKMFVPHRIIWEMHNGEIPDGWVVDHLDGNSLNNHLSNLQMKPKWGNIQNQQKQTRNSSGFTGIGWHSNAAGNLYCVASWSEKGKRKSKAFSVLKHGREGALELAKNHRIAMLRKLNESGSMYTERHISNTK